MTEPLHNFLDFELSNDLDSRVEEEDDKLNDLTFNSEQPWDFDEVDVENDNFFKTFQFDRDNQNVKKSETFLEKESDDLLGLTGSLINFRIFKTHHAKTENNVENVEYQALKDDEFAMAFQKLDLVDRSPVTYEGDNLYGKVANENEFSIPPVLTESSFSKLSQFSEMLHNQFQQYVKQPNTNLHVLNQIVSNHLNCLSKQLQVLHLSMDVLPQLRYFRILMNFVAIDNRLTEIQTKFSSNPEQLNREIGEIIRHFSVQTLEDQVELCGAHPFYSSLMVMLAASGGVGNKTSYGSSGVLPEWATDKDKHRQEVSSTRHDDSASWMSDSERNWLISIQTKNLTPENPYVHDYYYTKLKLKELTEARTRQILEQGHTTISDPLSLLPSPITVDQLNAGISQSNSVMPGSAIHFEKALGVLSPSSLHAPRQILQLSTTALPRKSIVCSSVICSHRDLLALIEKMYSIVLRVDEVDKSLARMLVKQHQSRGVLLQHRNYLLKLLVDCCALTSQGNNGASTRLVDLLSVAKGARVFVSTIAIVTAPQFIQLLRVLFFNCLSVAESQFFPEIKEELRSIVCSRIRNLAAEDLATIVTAFFCGISPSALSEDSGKLQPLAAFCSSEFGLYIVLTVLDTLLRANHSGKAHVTQMLSITIKSTESQVLFSKCMKDFKNLFPTSNPR